MNSINFEGLGKINGGEYESLVIEGVCSCGDHITTDNLRIKGVFHCSGEVEAKDFYCDGVADFKANIRAKRFTVGGVFSQKGDAKIEAEEINCSGVMKTGGEISADILRVEGIIGAKEIVGDQVIIDSYYHGKKIVNMFTRKRSEIKLIEATTVTLRGVDVETVNGRDITIGPKCNIDNIDCSGTLNIDGSSYVRNITGNYTKI